MRKYLTDLVILVLLGGFSFMNLRFMRADLNHRRGEQKMEKGLVSEALEHFESAIELAPHCSRYHRSAGLASLAMYQRGSGNLRPLYRARYACQRALSENEIYPYHWHETGKVEWELSMAGEDVEHSPGMYFEKAVEIDPANYRFLSSLVAWRLAQGDREGAWPPFVELVKSYPEALGIYGPYLIKNDGDLERIKKAAEERPLLVFELSRFLLSRGAKEQARRTFETAASSLQRAGIHPVTLADFLAELDMREEAVQTLLRVIKSDWQSSYSEHLIFKVCDLLGSQGEHERTMELLQEALEHDPKKWRLSYHLAVLARNRDKDELALQAYDHTLKYNTWNLGLRKKIIKAKAEIKLENGDLEGALEEYKLYLRLEPDDKKIARKVQRLELSGRPNEGEKP